MRSEVNWKLKGSKSYNRAVARPDPNNKSGSHMLWQALAFADAVFEDLLIRCWE